MKALILAAGYGTRLYPLTLDKAKALLPVGEKPIVEYVIGHLEKIEELDEIFVVSNEKFAGSFQAWADGYSSSKKIKIVNDSTTSDETKLGGIGDLNFVLSKEAVTDDLLMVAGDNLFDFSLAGFVRFAQEKKPYAVTGAYDVGDRALARKYGILELDGEGRVVGFVEKPSEPRSTLAGVGLYHFPGEKLHLVSRYLAEGNQPDQPGNYIGWLMEHDRVYGFVFQGVWFDIGDMESYRRANAKYGEGIK